MTWYDYRFTGSSLALAKTLMETLLTSGNVKNVAYLNNMLGDPIYSDALKDEDGNSLMICRGRQGRAAYSYTDPDMGIVNVPAAGDPALWYFAVRALVPPGQLPFVPATYGLAPCDQATSAAVLGVWA